MTEEKVIGRNEPCPCNSGKKYKRCCGVTAAPKITPPKPVQEGSAPAFDPSAFANMNPELMAKFSQALQRLPKGQLQRLQVLMQKAMSGKNIVAEAADFERTLPAEFQNLVRSFGLPQGGAGAALGEASQITPPESEPSAMSEAEARKIVAQAVAEGKISEEKAKELLK